MLSLLAAAALAGTVEGSPLESLTLRFDSRYDSVAWGDERHRLQNSALVGFTVDTLADVDLVGMVVTGSDFTSRWSTWRDLQGGEPDRMALSLRQLYLQRWFGPVRVQAGSLAPVKGTVSTSGLEDLGWIDGVRVEWHTGVGLVVEGVGGSLFDVEEPDLFIRERRLNYAELELSYDLPRGFVAEAAFHDLGADIYAKGELGWEDPAGRWPSVRVEGSYNVTTPSTLAVAGLDADLLHLATGREGLAGWLRLRSHIRWVDPDYGRFGTLSEDFYQFGTEWRTRLDGRFDPRGIVGWNVRYIAPVSQGLDPRLDIGVVIKLRIEREDEAG